MNNNLKSSEALKAYAREVLCGNNPTNSLLIRMFDEIIDNAPTVDISGNEYFPYRTAYFNGVADGRATARPQGEWIKADNLYDTVVCNKCGGIRRDNRIDHIAFCNKCGADMRGDKE